MPVIPPPKKEADQQKQKATVPPQKTNILLMNGDTTGNTTCDSWIVSRQDVIIQLIHKLMKKRKINDY